MNPIDGVARQIAAAPTLRVRQGEVVSVSSYGVTVTIAGSSTPVTGVRYLGSYAPQVGAHVWLLTDGDDMFAIGHLAPRGVPALQVSISSALSLVNNVEAAVQFDTVEGDDPWEMFDVGSDTRLTVPLDGWYSFTAYGQFAANGSNVRALRIREGGSDIVAAQRMLPANSGTTDVTVTSGPVSLSADDYVELLAYQNSGGALNLDVCVFRVHYIGPSQ